MILIFALLGALDLALHVLSNLNNRHLVAVPDSDGNKIFASFNVTQDSGSKLLAVRKGSEW